jgi:hypothetical protein
MGTILLTIKTVFLVVIACSISYSMPSLYICRHIIFEPDTAESPELTKVILDSTRKYFSSTFTINDTSTPDEARLIAYHQNFSGGKNVSLANETFCPTDYILCTNARSTVRYGTSEDINVVFPSMFPGGGMSLSKVRITDDNPEYHYETEIRFTIYRSTDGRKMISWTGRATSQEDSALCYECIHETIGDITESSFRHLSSKDPFSFFAGITAGGILPLEWYQDMGRYPGLNFGAALKITMGKIAGIEAHYSYHAMRHDNIISHELYIGPCFGYRIFTSSPLIAFFYPNLSYGISTFWNYMRDEDSDTLPMRHMPVVAAFSAKAAVLISAKKAPIAIEPNVRLIIRTSSGSSIIALSPGIRIGYIYNRKKFR